MTLDQFILIAHFSTALTFVGFLLAVYHFRARQRYIKLLGLLLLVSAVAANLNFLAPKVGVNPNYVASIYNLLELPLIILIFVSATNRKVGPKDWAVASVYICFALYNILFLQKQDINSYTLIPKSVIVIIYSLNYFYWLLMKLPTTELHRLPMFWINSSWIIFYSGNFFLFSFTSYLVHGLNNDLLLYWTLHNVLLIIARLMIIFALWVDFRNIKSHS